MVENHVSDDAPVAPVGADGVELPPISLRELFLRFLRFGLLAWGGPVAQIGMIRHELVDEARWVDSARFNRVLAVYQALPGPEAHELCVYLGFVRRGRLGGLVAGLGFMLPGLLLMLGFSWAYVEYGISGTIAAGLFWGFAPAVAALVLRAVHRIAGHALRDRWLVAIAIAAAATHLSGLPFAIPLVAGGIAYVAATRRRGILALALIAALLVGSGLSWSAADTSPVRSDGPTASELEKPTLGEVAAAGARGGLLTFGGAYTAIPFIEQDAVRDGHWLTRSQFLDGLAIGSALPAPLIIFSTFVGYVGGGLAAALLMTLTIFAPAFAFTLLGHRHVERAVENERLHALLDGITAAVVGLMLVTAATLTLAAVSGPAAALILVAALLVLAAWKSRLSIVAVMAGSGALGVLHAYLG